VLYSALLRWGAKQVLRSLPPLHETIPLIGISSNAGISHTQRSRVAEELLQLNDHSNSELGLSIRLFADVFKLCKNLSSRREEVFLKVGLALLFVILFVSATIGGILSANVVLDSVAACKSPHCGFWGAIKGGPSGEATSLRINRVKQNTAAAQAAQCYRETFNSECSNLISKRISYTMDPNAACPLNGDVCISDAFRMDTGYQNSINLGASSAQKFLFRRSTTCAPVLVNETYAKRSNDSTGSPTWKYYYGDGADATFETPIRPISPGNAAYIVR
jgi:hypothetical protein